MSTTILNNETTGHQYQGGNIQLLAAAAFDNGYSTDHGWAGFNQWKSAGRVVRKGEKGTRILMMVPKKIGELEDGTDVKKMTGRTKTVFHYDQTEELGATEEAN